MNAATGRKMKQAIDVTQRIAGIVQAAPNGIDIWELHAQVMSRPGKISISQCTASVETLKRLGLVTETHNRLSWRKD